MTNSRVGRASFSKEKNRWKKEYQQQWFNKHRSHQLAWSGNVDQYTNGRYENNRTCAICERSRNQPPRNHPRPAPPQATAPQHTADHARGRIITEVAKAPRLPTLVVASHSRVNSTTTVSLAAPRIAAATPFHNRAAQPTARQRRYGSFSYAIKAASTINQVDDQHRSRRVALRPPRSSSSDGAVIPCNLMVPCDRSLSTHVVFVQGCVALFLACVCTTLVYPRSPRLGMHLRQNTRRAPAFAVAHRTWCQCE